MRGRSKPFARASRPRKQAGVMNKTDDMRPYPEFPEYLVSPDGHIYSDKWLGRGFRQLKEHPHPMHGYHWVQMTRSQRTFHRKVHKVVALTFLPPKPSEEHQLRHLDGDKSNNAASNLVWGTALENAADRDAHGTTARGERVGGSKLSDAEVCEIKQRLASGERTKDIAADYRVTLRSIQYIKSGAKWAHI